MTLCTVYYKSTVEDELILADLTDAQKAAVERHVADLKAEIDALEDALKDKGDVEDARNMGYESGFKDGKKEGERVARVEIKKAFETFREFAGF